MNLYTLDTRWYKYLLQDCQRSVM